MSGMVGVAISTTGDEHRLGFLETTVRAWRGLLPLGSFIAVTVDGDEAALARAQGVVDREDPSGRAGGYVVRVGQPNGSHHEVRAGRLGVAVNKNTGIEALMDVGCTHLFLCDDDARPKDKRAITLHTDFTLPHSMVCWGKHRLDGLALTGLDRYARWSWPRGVMLYARSYVIDRVGGMDENFGPGGHEHVEWSQRIHNAGCTPAAFASPVAYAADSGLRQLWDCEDMRKPQEQGPQWQERKARNTTVRREPGDWTKIDALMLAREGSSDFVPYRAHENGRLSATLSPNLSRGAGE